MSTTYHNKVYLGKSHYNFIDVPEGQLVPWVSFPDREGTTLFQSDAIARLLARGSELYGGDWYEQAKVDEYLEFFKSEIEGPVSVVVYMILGNLDPPDQKLYH